MVQQITQTISTLPPSPDRSDPSTFSDRADALLGSSGLPQLVSEENEWAAQANAVATEVNTNATNAASSESVATAAANFKGSWSSLTGAASVPYSVAHNDAFWMLLSDITDITASEPGVSSDWERINPFLDWERKTASFTAESGKSYKVDAGVTATLPTSPTDNEQIWFSPLGDIETTNSTIARAGTEKIMGLPEDMTWDANVSFSLIYDSTNTDWRFA